MAVVKKEFTVPSSDGIHALAGMVFCPAGEIKGFFHIVHGMTEYIGRYERFMNDVAEAGYVCFGYDNLGHGHTAMDDSELGFIAEKNGWDLLAQDVRIFSDAVMKEYKPINSTTLPYCLMGHSMGSFIVRIAAEKYVTPDRLIIMGTGGSNPVAGLGIALTGIVKHIRGGRRVSPLVNALAFGNYNRRFEKELSEAPSQWLTTDASIRKKYADDKFCTFQFSVSAMGDLIRLTKYSNRNAWYKNLPKSIPVLLISGEEDPVGGYGKGVREVCEKLKQQQINVKLILYPNARHEILNDFTYGDTKRDILAFCACDANA
ncbi:MAG: alpha/beta fold hydrolase [Clostridia bacterium]|nr:alpha/beta fold hydrolase [Clostridia bacterium]